MVVVSLLVIRNSVEVLRTVSAGNNARARLCSDCFGSASVGFVAACQILFRACLEVCFIPAGATKAEAWHGQHLLQLRGLTGRTINQWRVTDLLNGFQLMTTGSALVIVHGHWRVSTIRERQPIKRVTRQSPRLYLVNRAIAAA